MASSRDERPALRFCSEQMANLKLDFARIDEEDRQQKYISGNLWSAGAWLPLSRPQNWPSGNSGSWAPTGVGGKLAALHKIRNQIDEEPIWAWWQIGAQHADEVGTGAAPLHGVVAVARENTMPSRAGKDAH